MKRFLSAALAACVVGLFAVPVWAGQGVATAKFGLHVQAWSPEGTCVQASPIDTTGGKTPTPCSQYNTAFATNAPTNVYLIIANVDSGGIAGATFGIKFGHEGIGVGVDVVNFTRCTSGPVCPSTGWPAVPGSGNIITWEPGQCAEQFVGGEGQHGLVGVFYIYAYDNDFFKITEHPLIPDPTQRLAVANCANENTFLAAAVAPAASCFDFRFGGTQDAYWPVGITYPKLIASELDPSKVEKDGVINTF